MSGFVFATGVENSAPVITGPDGRDLRRDEMSLCGHDERYAEDFACARALGLTHLRYGVPYYRVHVGPGRFDWAFSDLVFASLRESGLIPIIDLCHFGVPDWLGNFQNPEFPLRLAEYARAFATRYPWVRLYTPVNEMYVAARFSALYGWWNERRSDERSYVTALKHIVAANVRAARAILEVRPDAVFVQSESSEYHAPAFPDALDLAHDLNERRFLPLDLAFGHDVSARTYRYLLDNGMTAAEYDWFRANALIERTVLGNDYYATNEHIVHADGRTEPSMSPVGYFVVTGQYFRRYNRPVMHTEANLQDAERAPDWLRSLLRQAFELIDSGVPTLGFTWYSLTDQVDWDSALKCPRGRVNPLGLYDLDRKIRPVGVSYKEIVEAWRPCFARYDLAQSSLW